MFRVLGCTHAQSVLRKVLPCPLHVSSWAVVAMAILLGFVCVDTAGAQSADKAALEALYEATNGDNWTRDDNWKTDRPLNEWHGVTTSSTGRVTQLSLENNQLEGSIPTSLRNLTRLTELNLSSNQDLEGEIPSGFTNLTGLTQLWLQETSVNCDPLTYDPPNQDLSDFLNSINDFRCPNVGSPPPGGGSPPPGGGSPGDGGGSGGCAIAMEGEMGNAPQSTVFNLLLIAAAMFSAILWKSRTSCIFRLRKY